MFQQRAIKRNVVRDAVNDDRVVRDLIEIDGAGAHKFGFNAGGIAGGIARIDALD